MSGSTFGRIIGACGAAVGLAPGFRPPAGGPPSRAPSASLAHGRIVAIHGYAALVPSWNTGSTRASEHEMSEPVFGRPEVTT